jgi:hypothetical protein
MKLYTEEQMKELMYWTMKMTVGCVHSRIDDFKITENAEQKLKSIKSLELPSDEEIEEASEAIYVPYDKDNDLYDIRFAKGAKWMKEQILNQSK